MKYKIKTRKQYKKRTYVCGSLAGAPALTYGDIVLFRINSKWIPTVVTKATNSRFIKGSEPRCKDCFWWSDVLGECSGFTKQGYAICGQCACFDMLFSRVSDVLEEL